MVHDLTSGVCVFVFAFVFVYDFVFVFIYVFAFLFDVHLVLHMGGLLLRDTLYGFLASDAGGGDKDGFLPLLRGAANHTIPYHANHTIPMICHTNHIVPHHTNDTNHIIPHQ